MTFLHYTNLAKAVVNLVDVKDKETSWTGSELHQYFNEYPHHRLKKRALLVHGCISGHRTSLYLEDL